MIINQSPSTKKFWSSVTVLINQVFNQSTYQSINSSQLFTPAGISFKLVNQPIIQFNPHLRNLVLPLATQTIKSFNQSTKIDPLSGPWLSPFVSFCSALLPSCMLVMLKMFLLYSSVKQHSPSQGVLLKKGPQSKLGRKGGNLTTLYIPGFFLSFFLGGSNFLPFRPQNS